MGWGGSDAQSRAVGSRRKQLEERKQKKQESTRRERSWH